MHSAKPDDVGNDLDRLESGVGEGVLPLLGGEEAGHRTRLGVERHVDEALEYLERELGTDRRGGERAQPLTEHEPPSGGEARQGLVENAGQVSRKVEDVDAPDEGERPRSDSLAGPGLVDVERQERERQTGTQPSGRAPARRSSPPVRRANKPPQPRRGGHTSGHRRGRTQDPPDAARRAPPGGAVAAADMRRPLARAAPPPRAAPATSEGA